MRVLTILLILIIANNSICQSMEGVWVQNYVREVIDKESQSSQKHKSDPLLLELDSLLKNIDAPKIDTFYQTIIKPFFFNESYQLITLADTGKYTVRNDSILITIKEKTLKGLLTGKEFMLFYNDQTMGHFFKWDYDSLLLSDDIFKSSWWKIFKGQDELFSVEFEDLRKGTFKRFDYGSTSELFKNSINFFGIPFLALTDQDVLDSHILMILDYSDDHFEGIYYYPEPVDKIPEQMLIRGKRMNYDTVELKEIKNKLVGNWYTEDLDNLGAYMFEYDTLVNTFCKLRLSDDQTFEMHHGGDLVNDTGSIFVEKRISGSWDLGKTGEYIKVSYLIEDSFSDDFYELTEYYSIRDLNSQSLRLNTNLNALDMDDTVVRSVNLKMTKK